MENSKSLHDKCVVKKDRRTEEGENLFYYTFKSKHEVHKNPKHVAVYHKEVGLIFFCCLAASRGSESSSSRAINALTQIGPRGSFSPSIDR